MSHAIGTIKRIREELDPYFVPLFRRQVYQWDDGSTKTFKNFGFGLGVSALVGVQKSHELDDAEKPTYGYLSKIEKAGRVSLWLPIEDRKDGTPGPTEKPDVWWFYFIKESLDYKKRLEHEARAKAIASLDYVAQREHFARMDAESAKRVATAKADAAQSFASDKRKINERIRDLTSSEFEQFKAEQKGLVKKERKPFVSLST